VLMIGCNPRLYKRFSIFFTAAIPGQV